MSHVLSPNVLKCPYCDKMLSSHKALRIHVGVVHREKIDEFIEEYLGGRSIEVDFVTLMLQISISDLTEEFCRQCDKCTVGCPISKVVEGFSPRHIISKARSGEVKDLLKSDIIWTCTSCLACKERCPYEISPYDITMILRNLSARIGYHFPKGYKDRNKKLFRLGIIQEPQMIQTKTGDWYERENLGLSKLKLPGDIKKFKEALNKLSRMRVIF